MAARTKVAYVDTAAFIAFLDRSDTYHILFQKLFSDPPPLITHSGVIAEGHGWFLKRYDQMKALEFLNFIHDLKVLVIQGVGTLEIERARRYLTKFSDQKLTLADALGLLLMDEKRIVNCWSTDHHLGLTGKMLAIDK